MTILRCHSQRETIQNILLQTATAHHSGRFIQALFYIFCYQKLLLLQNNKSFASDVGQTLFISCNFSLHLRDSQSMLTHLTQMLPSCSTQKLHLFSPLLQLSPMQFVCIRKTPTYRRYILFIIAHAENVLEKSVCCNFKANQSVTTSSNLLFKEAIYAGLLQLDKYINTEKPQSLVKNETKMTINCTQRCHCLSFSQFLFPLWKF